jgi:hypothetical protein
MESGTQSLPDARFESRERHVSKSWVAGITVLMICCLVQTQNVSAQTPTTIQVDYVRVAALVADIHTEPSASSETVVHAQQGEVFKHVGTEGEWYKIWVSTREERYLHESLAEKTEKPELQASQQVRRSVCIEIVEAQRQARAETDDRYGVLGDTPGSISAMDEWIAYRDLLFDRYELPVLRKYGISPALQDDLQCFNLLYRTSNLLGVVFYVFALMVPFVVIGLIGAGVLTWRNARAKADGAGPNWRVFLPCIFTGTLISALLIAIGALLISTLIVPLGGGGGIIFLIVGILGLLVVGSYIVAARIMAK